MVLDQSDADNRRRPGPYLFALVILTLMVFLEKVKPFAERISQFFFFPTDVVEMESVEKPIVALRGTLSSP